MSKTIELTSREIERYDRQIRLSELGLEGQRKLKGAKVLVAGLGGLGCPASIYLVAAGIGRVILVDRERVELSNLNRQILHWDKDIGRFKVDSAVEKLRQLNQDVEVEGRIVEINEENVYNLVKEVDVVVDGMDNFKTRFILNKACIDLGVPFIHGAIYGLEGRLMTIVPGEGPCLRCLIPVDPPEIKPFPVLGATPGVIACLQAIEAVKLITGMGVPCVGKLLIFDGLEMEFHKIEVRKSPSCRVCGEKSK